MAENPHENIVRYKDSLLLQNSLAIIMQYCPNGSLKQYLENSKKKGLFPIDEE